MRILKKWIREFLSLFVFLKYENVLNLYDYLYTNKKLSGIRASVFTHYCDSHSSYIGIGAEFKNHPYFPHGLNGIFISESAVIGKNAVIFQQVTIGASRTIGSKNSGAPVIGDNCYIGAGAKIVGNITIGNNVRIGANAVVYSDVPDNCVVVAAETRIIQKEKLDNRFVKLINNEEYYWDNEKQKFVKL
ncbi:MAG: serine acetyltransferase [Erysipelotrichaceae bacterium]|nr:serine acetyltransferase [Erysipelotrichaceae bacterium]